MKNENGEQSAFANPGSDQGPGSSGLTKREYFAGLAMQSIISGLTMTINNDDNPVYFSAPQHTKKERITMMVPEMIKMALACSDELLKQLSTTTDKID